MTRPPAAPSGEALPVPIGVSSPPLTRGEAQARGLKRYFTGTPCAHGHVAERYLSGHCVVCLAERSKVTYARRRGVQHGTAS